MFVGNHLPELVVLLVVALVVFGPKRLPEIGGAMGKGIREFKKGTSGEDQGATDRAIPDPEDARHIVSESPERDKTASASTGSRRDAD